LAVEAFAGVLAAEALAVVALAVEALAFCISIDRAFASFFWVRTSIFAFDLELRRASRALGIFATSSWRTPLFSGVFITTAFTDDEFQAAPAASRARSFSSPIASFSNFAVLFAAVVAVLSAVAAAFALLFATASTSAGTVADLFVAAVVMLTTARSATWEA
jgi:hypothetical protein